MKKKWFWIFFLLQSKHLFCSLPVSLGVDLFSGFREDSFSYKLVSDTKEDVLNYREKFHHPKYIQSGICFHLLKNGFYLSSSFGYAPLLTHKMRIIDTDSDHNPYSFDYKTKGYDFGSSGEVGIAANLTPDRIYKFIVIPLGGYRGEWKIYKRRHPKQNPLTIFQNGDELGAYSSVDKKLRQIWYGPFVGGKIIIVPNDFISFDIAYHFNWMKLKLKFQSLLETKETDKDNHLIYQKIIEKNMDDTLSDSYSHNALLKITFNSSKRVKIALSVIYNYFMSDKEKGIVRIDTKEHYPVNVHSSQNSVIKVFSRWWNISGVFELVFQF